MPSTPVTVSAWNSSGTPIMSKIVSIGRRIETWWTKSPSGLVSRSSTMRTARAWICSSMIFTRRGVKAVETSLRSWVCRGASIARNELTVSRISVGTSSSVMPLPEQKSSGRVETSLINALEVTAQKPSCCSSGSIIEPSAGGCQLSGRSRRRTESSSSRPRGSFDQNASGESETGS